MNALALAAAIFLGAFLLAFYAVLFLCLPPSDAPESYHYLPETEAQSRQRIAEEIPDCLRGTGL